MLINNAFVADNISLAGGLPSPSPRRKWTEREPFTFDEADLSYLEQKENPICQRNRSGSSSQLGSSTVTSSSHTAVKELAKNSRSGSMDSSYKVSRRTKRSQVFINFSRLLYLYLSSQFDQPSSL